MIPIEELRRVVRYDAATGCVTRISGAIVATETHNGYLAGLICGRSLLMHRVAWALAYGRWPDGAIDHIDLNKKNNRIENLRVADASQNGANRLRQSNNKSGAKGVYWEPLRQKYKAHIRVRGRSINLGRYDDCLDAAAAYARAAERHFGEFARAE